MKLFYDVLLVPLGGGGGGATGGVAGAAGAATGAVPGAVNAAGAMVPLGKSSIKLSYIPKKMGGGSMDRFLRITSILKGIFCGIV